MRFMRSDAPARDRRRNFFQRFFTKYHTSHFPDLAPERTFAAYYGGIGGIALRYICKNTSILQSP